MDQTADSAAKEPALPVSSDGKIGPIDWADGAYEFRLGWGELIQLQEKCDAGPGHVLARMWANQWRMADISEVYRLGLIGAGKSPAEALSLVRDFVEKRPPRESLALAITILGIGVDGRVDGEETDGDAPEGEAPAPQPE